MDDCPELREFLEKLKLDRYFDILKDEGYESYDDLKVLKDKDIEKLDIKVPHRRRIVAEVEKLSKPVETAVPLIQRTTNVDIFEG